MSEPLWKDNPGEIFTKSGQQAFRDINDALVPLYLRARRGEFSARGLTLLVMTCAKELEAETCIRKALDEK
jgi:hypothetical protein